MSNNVVCISRIVNGTDTNAIVIRDEKFMSEVKTLTLCIRKEYMEKLEKGETISISNRLTAQWKKMCEYPKVIRVYNSYVRKSFYCRYTTVCMETHNTDSGTKQEITINNVHLL